MAASYIPRTTRSIRSVFAFFLLLSILLTSCSVELSPTNVPENPTEQALVATVVPTQIQEVGLYPTDVPETPTKQVLVATSVPTQIQEDGVSYNESPMLADLVEQGILPPIEERLPDTPVVVKPLEEIGQFGGTIRVATLSPSDLMDGLWVTSIEGLLRIGPDAREIYPNIVREWKLSEDATSLTMELLDGVRWSDGEPFTADDVMFWWDDFMQNKEIIPTLPATWEPGGKPAKMTKVNDYTVRFDFAVPYPDIIKQLAHFNGMLPVSFPKHYLKDFHPTYADADALAAKVEESGLGGWQRLFLAQWRNSVGIPLNPDMPTLQPYVIKEVSSERFVFERNPYYWKVDTEGNQLPYIDRIEVVIVNSGEVMTAKILAGEVDLAAQTAYLDSYPLYAENAEKSDYRVLLWPKMETFFVQVNMTSQDPVLREIFQDVRFRHALSLAINRDEINELAAFGLAKPEQLTVAPSSSFYQSEFAQSFAEYAPDKANQLLDEMGLIERDTEGYRQRPDGKRLQWTLELNEVAGWTRIAELLRGYWQDVGLDVQVVTISSELAQQRLPANEVNMYFYIASGLTDQTFLAWPHWYAPIRTGQESTAWPAWALWYQTKGDTGEEPPQEIKELQQLYEQLLTATDPDEQKRIGTELVQRQAENLWAIGVLAFAPSPLVVKNQLRNVPEEAIYGWDTVFMYAYHPEQFFLKK